MAELSHIDNSGKASMVDVSGNPVTKRIAKAQATISMSQQCFEAALAGNNKKGNIIAIAQIAGIMAAKKTSDIVPLCHPLALSKVDVTITPDAALPGFAIVSNVVTSGQTGVEMEAICAAAIAAVTLYDMLKAVDKNMEIGDIKLIEKSGGRSGVYFTDPRPIGSP